MRQNPAEMTLAERISLRLEQLGKTERGASLEAGLSDSFLRNIRQKKSGSPRVDTLEKVAKVLATSLEWLMTGNGDEDIAEDGLRAKFGKGLSNGGLGNAGLGKAQAQQVFYGGFRESDEPYAQLAPSPYPSDPFRRESAAPIALPPASVATLADTPPNALVGKKITLGERRLPVYGQAVGGIDGEFPINGSALYSVLCPPQLSEISGAYAVSISGDSMYPRYEDGEIAFVDPTRRIKKGDYVIAQIVGAEGAPPLAYVKKFIRHNAAELILEQFNPQKQLSFPHRCVVSVHYIALAGTAPQ